MLTDGINAGPGRLTSQVAANRRHIGGGVALARESLDHRRVWITRRRHPGGPGSGGLLAHIRGRAWAATDDLGASGLVVHSDAFQYLCTTTVIHQKQPSRRCSVSDGVLPERERLVQCPLDGHPPRGS